MHFIHLLVNCFGLIENEEIELFDKIASFHLLLNDFINFINSFPSKHALLRIHCHPYCLSWKAFPFNANPLFNSFPKFDCLSLIYEEAFPDVSRERCFAILNDYILESLFRFYCIISTEQRLANCQFLFRICFNLCLKDFIQLLMDPLSHNWNGLFKNHH